MATVKLASDAPEGAGRISYGNEEYEVPFTTYDAGVVEYAQSSPYFEVENPNEPDPAEIEAAEKAAADAGVDQEDTARVKASPADLAKSYKVPASEAETVKERRNEIKDATN